MRSVLITFFFDSLCVNSTSVKCWWWSRLSLKPAGFCLGGGEKCLVQAAWGNDRLSVVSQSKLFYCTVLLQRLKPSPFSKPFSERSSVVVFFFSFFLFLSFMLAGVLSGEAVKSRVNLRKWNPNRFWNGCGSGQLDSLITPPNNRKAWNDFNWKTTRTDLMCVKVRGQEDRAVWCQGFCWVVKKKQKNFLLAPTVQTC